MNQPYPPLTPPRDLTPPLDPLEHIDVAPAAQRSALKLAVSKLPALLGDALHECLEEPQMSARLNAALTHITGARCLVLPRWPQEESPLSALSGDAAPELLVLLASQRPFHSPRPPRPRQGLREALDLCTDAFERHPALRCALLVADYWDAKLMGERRERFESHLRQGQSLVPALLNGGLLTPLCYL